MEHPYLFIVKFFELIGFGHFAHAYPWVIYSWFVMILLIVLAFLGVRKIDMIPSKAQNVFEILISGLEEFMVDITGEEGGKFFALIATVFLYIATCNLLGLVPAMATATRIALHERPGQVSPRRGILLAADVAHGDVAHRHGG